MKLSDALIGYRKMIMSALGIAILVIVYKVGVTADLMADIKGVIMALLVANGLEHVGAGIGSIGKPNVAASLPTSPEAVRARIRPPSGELDLSK